MRKTLPLSLLLLGVTLGVQPASSRVAVGQSASNGVYGGYVGSAAWFSSMRRAAENEAMLRALGHSSGRPGEIPAEYIEFAGQITFPRGNPFPNHRLPDLRIKCRDTGADPVERAPHLGQDGSFYTVFKKGQTYDLYWMYYFGSREKFGNLIIANNAPRQLKGVIEYSPAPPPSPPTAPGASAARASAEPARGEAVHRPPPDADRFDLSGLPKQPTNFEEQQIFEAVRTATSPGLKAFAHAKLARYYEKKGDSRRAAAEAAKAEYWRNTDH